MDTNTSTNAAPVTPTAYREDQSQPLPAAETTPGSPAAIPKGSPSFVDTAEHQREDDVEPAMLEEEIEEMEEFFDCQSEPEPEPEPEYASSDSEGGDRYLLLAATASPQ